jgi:hypothetical protein
MQFSKLRLAKSPKQILLPKKVMQDLEKQLQVKSITNPSKSSQNMEL